MLQRTASSLGRFAVFLTSNPHASHELTVAAPIVLPIRSRAFSSNSDGTGSGKDAPPPGDKAGDAPASGGSNGGDGGMFDRVARRLGIRDRRASQAPASDAATALVAQNPEQKHRQVLVVELARKPLFPGIYTPVLVSKNEKLIKEVLEAKKAGGQAYVGAFLKRPDAASVQAAEEALVSDFGGLDAAAFGAAHGESGPSSAAGTAAPPDGAPLDADPAGHLHEVGTFAQVHTILTGDAQDTAQLLLLGHRRIRRLATHTGPPLKVSIEHLKDQRYDQTDYFKATCMEIVNTLKELLALNPLYGEQFKTMMSLSTIDLNDNSRLVDAAASLTSADDATLQGVLEQLDVGARARAVMELLKKEVELCRLQADIREQVETKIAKEQRRMLLMEQLKSIKKELGLERDDKSALLQRFRSRWQPKAAAAPEQVATVVKEEMEKLSGLEPVSPEFNITRTYLEWLTSLPWGTTSTEIFDLAHAQQVLDEDHYGLEDVKERILEFIAVSRLRGTAQGKILCLVGPPGVGKTSIGRSIARTLGRQYFRFSVGGLYDVAEIKGHRRTYVGAMPGKMVQCLKNTGTCNPLVLIDEIDKLGRGHQGDPASALLELLDPEQNATFLDHYLDVPIDLSKVLFVCTANVLDTIPGPLLDRMEVIRLSGYAADEKQAITRRYLEVQARQESGVPQGAVRLTDGALETLINEYCREAGVRNLKKHVEKLYRKSALRLVQAGAEGPPMEGGTAAGGASSEPGAAAPAAEAGAEGSAAAPPASAAEGAAGAVDGGMLEAGVESTPAADGVAAEGQAEGAAQGAAAVLEEIVVDVGNLKDFVGQPPFGKDRFYEHTPPGVVMGLAWTAMGGATLYVEAARVVGAEGGGGLQTTGQLGDVFRESAVIAHTFARGFLAERDPHNEFFNKSSLHVHVPAGATPKDGPSAGCTLITALLSLALGRSVRPDLAMTGEVTLTGRVLPIGGVKEKVLAARRSGVKVVVFPEANKRDWEELTDDLRAGLEPHFVDNYFQIFTLALEHDAPLQPHPPPPAEEGPAKAAGGEHRKPRSKQQS